VWDHFYPIMGGDRPGSFESVASQAALAMATSRVRVGVLVYSVGYRHPAVLANAIATIDHLSGGRAEASLGAGWAKDEYDAYGLSFPPIGERIDMMVEGVECLAGLLREDRFSFDGRHFQLREASLGVRPVQERIPVWVGGVGEKRTIPLAARVADGWDSPLGPSADEFGRKVKVLERECERLGRDAAAVHRSAHIGLVRDEQQLRERFGDYKATDVGGAVLFGSDQRLLDGIRAFEKAGADQVLFAGAVRDGTEQLERVASLLGI
ncbi:MAG TPA: LLM class flavin-dependent oxidoreductase, partial [Candidatus Dormibacteraeota bacterium]|nr:LLM class flavin-dependent oxidoreductase [Candidatus Dormibacteraeota bacterium]